MTSAAAPPRSVDLGTPSLLLSLEGPADTCVARLTLSRPDRLNAVDASMHTALAGVWSVLAELRPRVVVLTGAGAAFSAGGDLDHVARLQADPELRRQDMRQAAQIVRGVLDLAAPVVAVVPGPAVGLGASLVALSDLALLAESAWLSDPHVSVGLTAADGGLSLLPWLVGLHRAKEHLLLGGRMDARTAVAAGLGNRVVPDEELAAAADALVARLLRQPRLAVETTKRGLNRHLAAAVGEALDLALADEERCFDDAEHHAAVARARR